LPVYPPQRTEPRPLARPRRPQIPEVPLRSNRKLAGRFTLAVLLLLAVITGSLAGLTLVYSVDLPQINDLERYRPSTTTELYDIKGRVIGSFALERREIIDYNARPSSPLKTRASSRIGASMCFVWPAPRGTTSAATGVPRAHPP
jgi:hypothetical protein